MAGILVGRGDRSGWPAPGGLTLRRTLCSRWRLRNRVEALRSPVGNWLSQIRKEALRLWQSDVVLRPGTGGSRVEGVEAAAWWQDAARAVMTRHKRPVVVRCSPAAPPKGGAALQAREIKT